MRVQEVISRAMAKRISRWQTAEIIGISEDRQMHRWREGYEELATMGGWINDATNPRKSERRLR